MDSVAIDSRNARRRLEMSEDDTDDFILAEKNTCAMGSCRRLLFNRSMMELEVMGSKRWMVVCFLPILVRYLSR